MYHIMPKAHPSTPHPSTLKALVDGIAIGLGFLVFMAAVGWGLFEKQYAGRIYPNVVIDGVSFGGKTKRDVTDYWNSQNIPFGKTQFEFRFEDKIATISGSDLGLGYDATLSATQAYAVGRSGHLLSDFVTKFVSGEVPLTPYYRWKTDLVDSAIQSLSDQINSPAQDALFQYTNGRVTAFKQSHDGRAVNVSEAIRRFTDAVTAIPHAPVYHIVINLPVETVHPRVTTDQANSFGIKELIGSGYSEFAGSIPGRVHNVALAASRLNGVLIAPGETFSFDQTVGDISAATGYDSAYIIKDGHTVLGDGGGVCQVSTTLFRAALNAGLPIVERHAHAYRVHYYEEGGFKAGLDATVFAPSVDLKFKNDTPSYILIQAKTDTSNLNLTFELYGTSDGRSAQIFNQIVYGETPPPPDLYQDDPTLAPGQVKQVDFSAWGAKASFQYKVTRGNEVLEDQTFTSNFQPWQAVFLRGPQV